MGSTKKLIILLAVLALISVVFANNCPLPSQTYSCSPKCIENYECTHGKLCCANSCNAKSCVEPAKNGAGSGSSKDKYGSGAGNYCGNVKCSPFESCKMDKVTNRMKCMRS